MPNEKLIGLILMGGQSARMGKDKAFVKYQDRTLLDHALRNLESITSEVFLSVNANQFETLKQAYNCIQDIYVDKGPMGGILSALEELNQDLLVLAVDMPNVAYDMLSGLNSSSEQVIAYRNPANQWEPLPSYWPKTILNALSTHLAENRLSLNGFLQAYGQANNSNIPMVSFKNLNSPSDLA